MSSRRDVIGQTLLAFPAYALLGALGAAAATMRDARGWIEQQQEIALALSRGEIRPSQWQDDVASLAREVELPKLMEEVGRADIKLGGPGLATDPVKRTIWFRNEAGDHRKLRYAAALFTFAPGNVITPHGHRHMVSAHLVVEGAFRLRNFDRVRDEAGAIVIRPTVDATIAVGDISTMSLERNNIHWFVPLAERAATFDFIVDGLDAGAPRYEIAAVDPVRGEPLSDGTIRAPILSFEESSRFYTREI